MSAGPATRFRRLGPALRLGAGVLAFAAAVGWWLTGAFGEESEIAWTEARIDDLVIGVDVQGTLASRDSSLLSPPLVPQMWDFQIRFMAPEGSQVAEGEPVLGFDTSPLDQRLLQLQAEAETAAKNIEKLEVDLRQQIMGLELQLAEAEASLRRARLQDDVPDDLRSSNEAEIAALDVELAQTEVDGLRGQIEAARQAGAAQRAALVAQRDRAEGLVAETRDAIARMTVRAPRAGTVIYATNWRGEKKKVGDSAWRRERLVELPDLNAMMAVGEVDESDSGRVAERQPVRLRLDAHPDIPFTGHVGSMWKTVQRKSFSRNPIKVVRLDIELDETDQDRMRPGMRFRGTVETQRIADALIIPVRSVFPTDEGPIVFRRTLLGFEEVAVQLGERNGREVRVLGGLRPGDLIAETNPDS